MNKGSKTAKARPGTPTDSSPNRLPAHNTRASAQRIASSSGLQTKVRLTSPRRPGTPDNNMPPKPSQMKPVTTEEEALNVLIRHKVITGSEQAHSIDSLIETMDTWSRDMLLEKGKNSIATTETIASILQAVMTLLGRYKNSYATLHNQITEGLREVKDELKDMMKEEIGRLERQTDKALDVAKDTAKEVHETLNSSANVGATNIKSYAYAADPKRAGKAATESLKLRLRLTNEGMGALQGSGDATVREAIMAALKEMGAPPSVSAKTVTKAGNSNVIVIEMKDDKSIAWLRAGSRAASLAGKLSAELAYRVYLTVLKFVPLTFDTTAHRAEFLEVNDLKETDVAKIAYIKAPEKRKPNQTHGHVFVHFTDPDVANEAIAKGLVVNNERRQVEKAKQEPLTCFNCRGSGHIAAACLKPKICGLCGEPGHTGQPNLSWKGSTAVERCRTDLILRAVSRPRLLVTVQQPRSPTLRHPLPARPIISLHDIMGFSCANRTPRGLRRILIAPAPSLGFSRGSSRSRDECELAECSDAHGASIDTLMNEGLPEAEFWNLFIQCAECGHVVPSARYPYAHRCTKKGKIALGEELDRLELKIPESDVQERREREEEEESDRQLNNLRAAMFPRRTRTLGLASQ
ncbi:hypothetical protein NMY22_g19068 [Coprinellus aureogranulatus]|nr:hypothetical protein NMY22_g19068 [Coprinellus aureogranulatus]